MISQEKAAFIRSMANAGGYIEPQNLVKAARNPRCVLHDEFKWDIREAAEAHWIETARKLIRFVKLEIIIHDQTVRSVAYVSDPARPSDSRRFIDLTIAAQNRDIAQQVLLDELERISNAIRRAQEVALVLGLRDQLDVMLADVSRLVAMAESKAAERRKAAQARAKSKRAKIKRGPMPPPKRGGTRPEART